MGSWGSRGRRLHLGFSLCCPGNRSHSKKKYVCREGSSQQGHPTPPTHREALGWGTYLPGQLLLLHGQDVCEALHSHPQQLRRGMQAFPVLLQVLPAGQAESTRTLPSWGCPPRPWPPCPLRCTTPALSPAQSLEAPVALNPMSACGPRGGLVLPHISLGSQPRSPESPGLLGSC